jgi:selT/selW/selH-like putative selenoprotein
LTDLGAEDVEIKPGARGAFEVFRDGKLLFSKLQLGRFPEDSEIDALAGQ